jgi:hypothetical protein
MREKCGIQGEENEVDGGNTSQGSKDLESTQSNADRHSQERLNHIEDEPSGDNSDVKNDEDSVLLQTSYKTPVDTAVYQSSDSLDGKVSEEPNNLAFPSYPRRNCPAKKNPDFLWP